MVLHSRCPEIIETSCGDRGFYDPRCSEIPGDAAVGSLRSCTAPVVMEFQGDPSEMTTPPFAQATQQIPELKLIVKRIPILILHTILKPECYGEMYSTIEMGTASAELEGGLESSFTFKPSWRFRSQETVSSGRARVERLLAQVSVVMR